MGAVQHVNHCMIEPEQLIRKRHEEYESFSVPLCAHCQQHCVWPYLIRYPIAAAGDEVCQCPCRAAVAA